MNMEQINKQYETLCAKIGDAEYKIRQLKKNLETFHNQIDKLNELAGTIKSLQPTKPVISETNPQEQSKE